MASRGPHLHVVGPVRHGGAGLLVLEELNAPHRGQLPGLVLCDPPTVWEEGRPRRVQGELPQWHTGIVFALVLEIEYPSRLVVASMLSGRRLDPGSSGGAAI